MNIHKTAKTTPKMRALIVARRQTGATPGQSARALGVSPATVNKWLVRHAREGGSGPCGSLWPAAHPANLYDTAAAQRGGGAAAPPSAVLEDCSRGRPVLERITFDQENLIKGDTF